MKKYRNKYRISSARLQTWDYAANGAYFITICTANRYHFFGEIVKDIDSQISSRMFLNKLGIIAQKYWLEIPDHFSFVKLGSFVIMPNHLHGILIIDKNVVGDSGDSDVGGVDLMNPLDPMNPLDLMNPMNPLDPMNPMDPIVVVETPKLGVSTGLVSGGKNARWKPGSIGVIINQYKRIVTINSRKMNSDFGWQSRFHDHIIRDGKSFERIQQYIIDNPINWDKDKFHANS